jgi:hypothetical protein
LESLRVKVFIKFVKIPRLLKDILFTLKIFIRIKFISFKKIKFYLEKYESDKKIFWILTDVEIS